MQKGKIIDLVQGSADWHSWRLNHIGASESSAVLGISPWMTAYQLWRIKTGLDEPIKTNFAMARGNALEAEARELAEEVFNCDLFPEVCIHSNYEWMSASFDGRSMDGSLVIEIKCPGKPDHQTALDGLIPQKYFPQLQHQMCVADVPSMYYFSYHPTFSDDHQNKYAMIEVTRCNKFIEELIQKEKEFWERVKTKTWPGEEHVIPT